MRVGDRIDVPERNKINCGVIKYASRCDNGVRVTVTAVCCVGPASHTRHHQPFPSQA
jgi:hypothetical protein